MYNVHLEKWTGSNVKIKGLNEEIRKKAKLS